MKVISRINCWFPEMFDIFYKHDIITFTIINKVISYGGSIMKKLITSITIALTLLVMFVLSVSADTNTIDVPFKITKINDIYYHEFNHKFTTADIVEVRIETKTIELTPTNGIIDLATLNFTDTKPITNVTGFASQFALLPNPDGEPFMIRATTDFKVKITWILYKVLLPYIDS